MSDPLDASLKGLQLRSLVAILACAVSLTACGHSAPDAVEIFVETTPSGAECMISQPGQTIGRIAPTPGIVLVPNIEADYYVSCSRDGYQPVSLMVQPGR